MKTLILSLLVGALAISALGANFSGKWVLQVPDRRGQMQQTILILNQVGNEVTGNILPTRDNSGSPANTEILDGKVEGETVTFYIWAGRDRPVKMMYKGTMAGEQITFTVTGEPITYDARGDPVAPRGPRQVTAKRAK